MGDISSQRTDGQSRDWTVSRPTPKTHLAKRGLVVVGISLSLSLSQNRRVPLATVGLGREETLEVGS